MRVRICCCQFVSNIYSTIYLRVSKTCDILLRLLDFCIILLTLIYFFFFIHTGACTYKKQGDVYAFNLRVLGINGDKIEGEIEWPAISNTYVFVLCFFLCVRACVCSRGGSIHFMFYFIGIPSHFFVLYFSC